MIAPAVPASAPPSHRGDLLRLLLVALVSVAVHAWILSNTSVTARDSIGFARYARNLLEPGLEPGRSVFGVLRQEKHPPGYPMMVAVGAKIVGAVRELPPSEQFLLGAQWASCLAGILLAFPSYAFARRLFDSNIAFCSALLLQLLPVLARNTSDGLSDGPFLLFVSTSLWLGVRALRSGGAPIGFLLAGLASAVAYLIRPEGLVLPVAFAGCLLLAPLAKKLEFAIAFRAGFAFLLGFAILAAPYMLAIGGITNKPAMAVEANPTEARLPVAGPLFAKTVPSDLNGAKRWGAVAFTAFEEWLKAAHYGVACYAILGLVLLLPRLLRDPIFWLPLLYGLGHMAVLGLLGFKQGYISERHLLPLTLLGAPFAVGGLPRLIELVYRIPKVGPKLRWNYWFPLTVGLLAALCVWDLRKPLHEDRYGHKVAGLRLAEELNRLTPEEMAGVVIVDHYEWAQFFSGRSLDAVRPDPEPSAQKLFYLVIELKPGNELEDVKFQSKRHAMALDLWRERDTTYDGEELLRYPTGKEAIGRTIVALWKLKRK